MFTPEIKTVGKFSQVNELRKYVPDLELESIEFILQGRRFERWYEKNKKAVNLMVAFTPVAVCAMFGFSPITLLSMATAGAGHVFRSFSPAAQTAYSHVDALHTVADTAIPAMAASGGGLGLFNGDGAILLHFLIIGFVTLIITTFLKFTGRGDLAPLVMFVAGGVMLLEVITLFNHIYSAVKTFLAV